MSLQLQRSKAYRVTSNWSSSAITWNNKPGYTTTGATGTISLDTGAWYKINVTTMVKNWRSGTYSNYGFMLKEPSESNTNQKTKFYSSDAPSPNKPELIINYTSTSSPYYGTRPYQSTSRSDINCMGYALEYPEYITGTKLNLSQSDMVGKTNAQLLSYIAAKAQTWMTSKFGTANFWCDIFIQFKYKYRMVSSNFTRWFCCTATETMSMMQMRFLTIIGGIKPVTEIGQTN